MIFMCNSQLIRWGILFQPRHVFVKNQFPLYPIQSSLEFQKWSKCLPLLLFLLLSLFLANFRESPARPARHVRFSIIVFFPEECQLSTIVSVLSICFGAFHTHSPFPFHCERENVCLAFNTTVTFCKTRLFIFQTFLAHSWSTAWGSYGPESEVISFLGFWVASSAPK